MAATIFDASGNAPPYTEDFTLADADVAYPLKLHRSTGQVVLTFVSAAGEVAYTGTIDVDLADAQHPLAADGLVTWPVYPARGPDADGGVLYLQTAAAGTVVVVSQLPRVGVFPE